MSLVHMLVFSFFLHSHHHYQVSTKNEDLFMHWMGAMWLLMVEVEARMDAQFPAAVQ